MKEKEWLCRFSSEEVGDVATCSKRRVTEENLVKDDMKKSRVEDRKEEAAEGAEPQASQSDNVKTEEEEEEEGGKEEEPAVEEYIIGETWMHEKWTCGGFST